MTRFNTWRNISNIAALRSLSADTNNIATVVNVVGYYSSSVTAAPDDGGGTFVYNASDLTTADNGGTIIVDTRGRRWYRQYDGGAINVKWFGAVGDNAADDTSAFQSAIDYAQTIYATKLIIPSGYYLITDTLTQITPLVWQGDSADGYWIFGSTLSFNHTNNKCISLDTTSLSTPYASQTVFRDLSFNGVNQSVLQHCIYLSYGSVLSGGGIDRCNFSGFTGCCVYGTPYQQKVYMNNISTSNVGGFIGSDDYPAFGLTCTMLTINNFNLDNALNLAFPQHAFFDFRYIREIEMNQIIVEAAGEVIPSIFRIGGNAWTRITGLHMEAISPVNTFEFIPSPYIFAGFQNGGAELCDVGLLGSDKPIYFNGTSNCGIMITRAGFSDPSSLVNWGTGANNHITLNDVSLGSDPQLTTDYISRISWNDCNVLSTTSYLPVNRRDDPFVFLRGPWIDGLNGGAAVVTVGKTGPFGETNVFTNEGMYNDSDEGRVFEVVSDTTGVPYINYTISPSADMVGNQLVIAMRCYYEMSQTDVFYTMVRSLGVPSPTLIIGENQLMPRNQWRSIIYSCIMPSSAFQLMSYFQASSGTASPTVASKLRIAAIYISMGIDCPLPIGGATIGKPLGWRDTVAPTYGDYVVGDQVTNSVPTVGQPKGWVCTVAGSPGTWVSLGNL